MVWFGLPSMVMINFAVNRRKRSFRSNEKAEYLLSKSADVLLLCSAETAYSAAASQGRRQLTFIAFGIDVDDDLVLGVHGDVVGVHHGVREV